MKRKLLTAACLALVTAALSAQAASDGFVVPLDEDLTKAVSAESAAPAAVSASSSSVSQGIWIETTSTNKALIRDVATGKKKGYEFDNSHFLSNANWWFWGDINKSFHLDAEISVWDFDKTLYQANTFAANVPDVSWGDGLQSIGSIFFAPITEASDNGAGSFNKMKIELKTPVVNVKAGMGGLKENGMLNFKGLFTVIDRWDDVGDGFLELSNGSSISEFGDFKVQLLAGFSRMLNVKSQPYGMYDLLDIKYSDKAELAFTFASSTTKEKLFYYNESNANAFSVYAMYNITDSIKAQAHVLASFASDVELNSDALAYAGKVSYAGDKINLALSATYAGQYVNSVWGSDGQTYDDINADKLTGQLDFSYQVMDFLNISLDESFTAEGTDALGEDLINLRSQPQIDFELSGLIDKDIVIGAYGVINADRPAKEVNADQSILPYFSEAGLEVTAEGLAFAKKIVFDYGVSRSVLLNEAGDAYETEGLCNSLMIAADINDKLTVNLGGLFNTLKDSDESFIPFGLALGIKVNSIPLPGNPMFWTHFTYAMNPYEDNNYTLFRADDPSNKAGHRTYLLNTLDTENASRISLGLIWNL